MTYEDKHLLANKFLFTSLTRVTHNHVSFDLGWSRQTSLHDLGHPESFLLLSELLLFSHLFLSVLLVDLLALEVSLALFLGLLHDDIVLKSCNLLIHDAISGVLRCWQVQKLCLDVDKSVLASSSAIGGCETTVDRRLLPCLRVRHGDLLIESHLVAQRRRLNWWLLYLLFWSFGGWSFKLAFLGYLCSFTLANHRSCHV